MLNVCLSSCWAQISQIIYLGSLWEKLFLFKLLKMRATFKEMILKAVVAKRPRNDANNSVTAGYIIGGGGASSNAALHLVLYGQTKNPQPSDSVFLLRNIQWMHWIENVLGKRLNEVGTTLTDTGDFRCPWTVWMWLFGARWSPSLNNSHTAANVLGFSPH